MFEIDLYNSKNYKKKKPTTTTTKQCNSVKLFGFQEKRSCISVIQSNCFQEHLNEQV